MPLSSSIYLLTHSFEYLRCNVLFIIKLMQTSLCSINYVHLQSELVQLLLCWEDDLCVTSGDLSHFNTVIPQEEGCYKRELVMVVKKSCIRIYPLLVLYAQPWI